MKDSFENLWLIFKDYCAEYLQWLRDYNERLVWLFAIIMPGLFSVLMILIWVIHPDFMFKKEEPLRCPDPTLAQLGCEAVAKSLEHEIEGHIWTLRRTESRADDCETNLKRILENGPRSDPSGTGSCSCPETP